MEQPNLNYINELSGDNEEFRIKLIGILKKELPLEIEQYTKEYEKGNFLEASQSVHKLKHKISILGLEKSYYLAEDYENNLRENSTNMRNDFESLLIKMQEFVNHL